jgi:hypothetical protein
VIGDGLNVATIEAARAVLLRDLEWYRVSRGTLTIKDGEVHFQSPDGNRSGVDARRMDEVGEPLIVTLPEHILAVRL